MLHWIYLFYCGGFLTRGFLQNPLVFAAGLVTGIVFSIDQSVCCCVDTGIKSAKLATAVKLLLTLFTIDT